MLHSIALRVDSLSFARMWGWKATAGKFAFTADDYDTYDICINQHRDGKEIHGEVPTSKVSLDVKLGVEAKSYEDLGKTEHLSVSELILSFMLSP